jgi:hypothetical protein
VTAAAVMVAVMAVVPVAVVLAVPVALMVGVAVVLVVALLVLGRHRRGGRGLLDLRGEDAHR